MVLFGMLADLTGGDPSSRLQRAADGNGGRAGGARLLDSVYPRCDVPPVRHQNWNICVS